MPYPDLSPSPTFWRCPACGHEDQFRASGVGQVVCIACHTSSTVEQLKAAHAQAHPNAAASAADH